jgi:hypothetical protein
MLGLPEWIVYLGMVPALGLTSLIAFAQALRGFEVFDELRRIEAAS